MYYRGNLLKSNVMSKPKVVIVGGGFGGLNVAKALKKAYADILIIDKTNHHLFQPLLYEVASAALSPADIAIPIREIVRKQENTSVIMGEIVRVDKENKKVILGNGDEIDYDYLVLSVGAKHSYFGNDQWEQFAPGLKTVQDAIDIRQQILISFEMAERLYQKTDIAKYLNFVIIGGGPTGVEMAGAIAEIAYKTMFQNFRKIEPKDSKIYLIEALPYILPVYPEKLSLRAKHDLEKMGVTVVTGKKVTDINQNGVQVEDLFIESHNIIWAAGNQASPLLKTLNAPLDRQGRVIVNPDLTIKDHPEVFVIGDAAHALGKNGKPLPGIAPTAIQQGKYVAKIIAKNNLRQKRRAFRYWDKGYMATIGKTKAVVVIRKLRFSGLFAWLTWCFIHIVYLIGFKNRFAVMIEWFFSLINYQRGARLIYRPFEGQLAKKNTE
jgi:NADH:quinone reductase (non-electrogenic)